MFEREREREREREIALAIHIYLIIKHLISDFLETFLLYTYVYFKSRKVYIISDELNDKMIIKIPHRSVINSY